MKLIVKSLLAALLLAGSAATSNAWFLVGHVYCDVNTNFVIDAEDVGVPGVMVVVTNFGNVLPAFSNSTFTVSDGSFVIGLPEGADLYGDYVVLETLPAG